MGSSPFTATTTSPVLDVLRQFLTQHLPTRSAAAAVPGQQRKPDPHRILIAFSGGPDSTCLLWGLRQLRHELQLDIIAAHFDHALDPASAARAEAARRLAQRLGVPFHSRRATITEAPGESLEAFARRQRYHYLEALADDLEADWIATAHHRDDQAETVLLRLLYGSGLAGLAAVQPRLQRRLRPLLTLSRQQLVAALEPLQLTPVDDPTNRDLRRPRNLLRHHLLPRWLAEEPTLPHQLARLAASTRRARRRIDALLTARLDPHPLPWGGHVAFERRAVEALPEELLPFAWALLSRRNGTPHPINGEARKEVQRQLRTQESIGCDCGMGWRLEADRHRIWMRPAEPSAADFAYTLQMPGRTEVPESAMSIRCAREKVAPWMFVGKPLVGAISGRVPNGSVTIRNRRPGDRIRPLGSARPRRLNDVLSAHRVPRPLRDRLPLLLIDGNIAWVPGVTVGDDFRLRREPTAWIFSIESKLLSPFQESVVVRVRSDDGSKERSKP